MRKPVLIDRHSEIGRALQALADGYPITNEGNGRWIVVENPEGDDEDVALRGASPNLVIDTWELFGIEEEDK